MKRDMSVTVTRDNTVTSHAPSRVTFGVTSRVSHATTTTPHHTMSLHLTVVGCVVKTKSNLTVTYADRLGIGGNR